MKLNLPDCGRDRCVKPCPPGVVICGDCASRMLALLDEVRDIKEALLTAEAHGLRFSSSAMPQSSTRGQRLPFNERAADARRLLEAGITDAARAVALELGASGHPSGLEACAAYIAENFRVIRSNRNGVAQYKFLDDVIAVGLRAVDRPADLMYVGVCGEATQDLSVCTAPIYVHASMVSAVCPECKWVHDVMSRRADLLARAEEQEISVTQMARAIAGVGGIEVTPKRIQNWVDRGKLSPSAYQGSKPLFKVKDVMDVLHAMESKRAARQKIRVDDNRAVEA